jgi:hypothetical protein
MCASAVCLVLAIATPWVFDDKTNTFLRGFVNHELLNFLGIIVTITLASAANLHLELNKNEERAGRRGFVETRLRLRRSVGSLIAMLLFAVVLVVAKPLIALAYPTESIAVALPNAIAVLIVIFNVLVLIDLTYTIFKLSADVR